MDETYRVTIRFYEELNYFIKKYPRKKDIQYSYTGRRSVKDLIESFGVPHVEVDLILVNGDSVYFDYIVCNQDRISVYPMFERFNITHVSLLRDLPLRKNRFVLDVHLGKLARHLRLLGFDTDYKTSRDDRELAKISAEDHRILLTRDRQLMMRKILQWGLIIRSDNPFDQIVEVMNKIDLWEDIKPFTRCISCNGLIEKLLPGSKQYSLLEPDIPSGIRKWCIEYNYCPTCNKVYWKGSHYESLMKRISTIKTQAIPSSYKKYN